MNLAYFDYDEYEEDDADLCHDGDDIESCQDECNCSNGCMDCLGLSWSDFM